MCVQWQCAYKDSLGVHFDFFNTAIRVHVLIMIWSFKDFLSVANTLFTNVNSTATFIFLTFSFTVRKYGAVSSKISFRWCATSTRRVRKQWPAVCLVWTVPLETTNRSLRRASARSDRQTKHCTMRQIVEEKMKRLMTIFSKTKKRKHSIWILAISHT